MGSTGKTRTILMKTVLLFSSVDAMVASALMVPVLADVAATFPNASPSMLNQTISLPSLLMIPSIIISGKLAEYISKKTLLMIGTFTFIAGGFGGMFSPNIEVLVITRGIEGIGMGIVHPIAPSIIAHLFTGKERAQLLGWCNACGAVFSFTLSYCAGWVTALSSWRYAFLLYLIFLIVVAMQRLYLPNFPPERYDETIVKPSAKDQRAKMGIPVYLLVIAMIIFMTIGMTVLFNLAIFISDEGIGDAADSGLANSLNTAASFCISLFFGYIFRFLGRYTSVVSLLLMTLSYYLLSIANNIYVVYMSTCCFGFSMGLMIPFLMTRMSAVAPKARTTMAMSLLSMGMFLGQFLSNYYAQIVSFIAQGSLRQIFYLVSWNLLACAVFVAVFIFFSQLNKTKQNANT